MSPRTPAGLAPQQLLHALWKQRTCWILLWLLATAVVLAAVWSMPRKFKSEATLAVEPLRQPGRNYAVPSDAELRAQLQLARLRVLRRDRLLEILRKSWPELVARWDARQAPREVERLRDRITIATLPESRGRFSAVRVSFESRDPARGAAVVNRLAIELVQEFDRLTPPPAAGARRQERNAAWARLAECEKSLKDFDSEHGPDLQLREQSLLKAIGTLQADLLANERMLEQTAAARQRLEETVEAGASAPSEPADLAGEPATKESATVRQLRERLALLRARYTDTHPDVRRAEQELARALALELPSRDAAPDNGPGPASRTADRGLERARAELNSASHRLRQLQQERQRLESRLEELQQQLTEVSGLLRRREALGRECKAAEAAYQSLSAKPEAESPGPGLRLVLLEEALPEGQPARPDRRLLALLGALFALLPATVIAASREIGARAVLEALGFAPPAANGLSITLTQPAGDGVNARHAAHAG
jgi:uncharacterized protein involved in exopolysaccharide biosynthesis